MRQAALAVLSLASALTGQSKTFVLPAGFSAAHDGAADLWLGANPREQPVHVQYVYATSQLPAGPIQLRQLAFRLWSAWPYSNDMWWPSILTLTVDLSHGPRAPLQTTPWFAANHGIDRKRVFQGKIKWPAARARRLPVPEPFLFPIKLPSPFPLLASRGKSLVLDIRVPVGPNPILQLDAAGDGSGEVLLAIGGAPICKMSNGWSASGFGGNAAGLTNRGGQWWFGHNSGGNTAGVMTFSAFNTLRRGNWPLPIDLSPVGMTRCRWHVGLETGIFVPLSNLRWRSLLQTPVLTMPPGLGGRIFFSQGFIFDRKANPFGAVATMAIGWRVGSGVKSNAAVVYALNDYSNRSAGRLRLNRTIVVQGSY